MTNQATSSTISNAMMGKIFSKAENVDDQWDGNTQLDSISGQQLGILMPNVTINKVECSYTAGLAAWRIQNSANLTFRRWGFGVKTGLACYESSMIAPYTINPNDIMTIYSLPVDDTAGETNVLAWVETTKGVELFEAKGVADGTATAMKTVVNEQTLGDSQFNSTLRSIHVQAEDGATVNSVDILDNSGGVVITIFGSVRGDTLGAVSLEYNLKADGLAVPIGKGFSLRVNTTSA